MKLGEMPPKYLPVLSLQGRYVAKTRFAVFFMLSLLLVSHCLGEGLSFFLNPASAQGVIAQIQRRIGDVLHQNLIPLVVVDLDDTLFLNAARNLFYLRKLMDQHSVFQDLATVTQEDFVGKTWDQWVFEYLDQSKFSPAEKQFRKDQLREVKRRFREVAIHEDQLISAVADYLNSLPRRVEIVYLTAREIEYRGATLDKMSKYKLPPGKVIFKELLESSSIYKGRRLAELLKAMPRAVLVATLDDDLANLGQMHAVAPQAIHARVRVALKSSGVEVSLDEVGFCAQHAIAGK
ncbi:MAG: hypothetical protein K2X47_18660 [Bdellovibrionales bacterium]|nr:hypothetical protein [Bdellovibrionales bacterium]